MLHMSDLFPSRVHSGLGVIPSCPLQLAGLGIAVANAGAPAKAAADVVLEETNDQDAVARAIERFVLS